MIKQMAAILVLGSAALAVTLTPACRQPDNVAERLAAGPRRPPIPCSRKSKR